MSHEFWVNLDEKSRSKLEQKKRSRTYRKREFIYEAGEIPKGIYLVNSGLVGLTAVTRNGNEQLLRVFRQGQYFGHRALLAEEPYHATATSLEASEICFIEAQSWRSALQSDPHFCDSVLKTLARELRDAEMRRLSISDDDVLTRAAEALIYLHELKPDHDWTRKEIALFIASTAPTIVRALAKLESRGLIRQSGRKIEILDRAGLLDAAPSTQ
jgi:CRP-like cAMP-binding protein